MALNAARARSLFQYSIVSGALIWRVDKARAKAGDRAGTCNGDPHAVRLRVKVDGKSYLVSRVIWLWVTGSWPVFEVDHVDTNTTNNAWLNLRDVTRKINQQNQRAARRDSKTAKQGVGRRPDGSIRARITVDGKQKLLGAFETEEAAHEAYVAAKRVMHEGNTL